MIEKIVSTTMGASPIEGSSKSNTFLQNGKLRVDLFHVVAQRPAATKRTHLQIFFDSHSREHSTPLGHVTDAHRDEFVGFDLRDIAALVGDRATRRRVQPRDHAQRRGFSGAVGSEQSDDLSLLDVEGDSVQGLNRSVPQYRVGDRQHQAFVSS
jgi:hypothetical protein